VKTILSFFLVILFFPAKANAGDSLVIDLNKTAFPAKDTIVFKCSIPDYAKRHLATATLNVWIESLDDKKVWKFRYPVLNGQAEVALAISDSIRPGKYAMNFILQEGLFKLDGNLRNNYSYKKLNYLALTKARESFFNSVELSAKGDFTVKNIVFEDEAYFIFSPGGKKKSNDLFISIISPLDSLFTPRGTFTQIIDVKPEQQEKASLVANYRFDFNNVFANTTLPEVTVVAKAKTKMAQYEKEFSGALFGGATRTYDGLDDFSISRAFSIGSFLQARIPGFRIDNDGTMLWRNQEVTIFLDEYKIDDMELMYINNDDIAMIKFYEAPAAMVQGMGPAVAIYMKKGVDENSKTRRYRFLVKGYTPIESEWK
jgi:hypothetical protein